MNWIKVWRIAGNHAGSKSEALCLAYSPENLQQAIDYALACRADSNKPKNTRTYTVEIY